MNYINTLQNGTNKRTRTFRTNLFAKHGIALLLLGVVGLLHFDQHLVRGEGWDGGNIARMFCR